jgi:Ring finger domain
MDLTDFYDLRFRSGPGIRGNDCDICTEPIAHDEDTVTHIACKHTFHRACFKEWADTNYQQSTVTTCPQCRATLSSLPPTSPASDSGEDRHFHLFSIAPREGLPTTSKAEMYDCDMRVVDLRGNFPGAAFIHHYYGFAAHWCRWLSDYFIRYRFAHQLSSVQVAPLILEQRLLLERTRTGVETSILVCELRMGEDATDLEIINVQSGERRPRPSVIAFYMENPQQGGEWLRDRMAFTQQELSLNLDEMYQIQQRFESHVYREIGRLTQGQHA